MVRLTGKKRMVYEYIVQTTDERGYPPSVREICNAVGLKSTSTVHTHIKSLEQAGLIKKDQNKTRAIALTAGAYIRVPLLGRVTAGSPIIAFEEMIGYVPFDTGGRQGDYFSLRVIGDSMINAGIMDGDAIVVRRQQSAISGEIVVGLLGEEATVKRLRVAKDGVWLLPENPEYDPIPADDVVILGKVIGVVRSYR